MIKYYYIRISITKSFIAVKKQKLSHAPEYFIRWKNIKIMGNVHDTVLKKKKKKSASQYDSKNALLRRRWGLQFPKPTPHVDERWTLHKRWAAQSFLRTRWFAGRLWRDTCFVDAGGGGWCWPPDLRFCNPSHGYTRLLSPFIKTLAPGTHHIRRPLLYCSNSDS